MKLSLENRERLQTKQKKVRNVILINLKAGDSIPNNNIPI